MEDSSEASDSTIGSTGGQTKKRLQSLRLKAKHKVQKLKNISGHGRLDHLDTDTHEALADLDEDPAFNPQVVQDTPEEHRDTLQSKVERTGIKIERVVDSVFHPQRSAKAKVAREIAKTLGGGANSEATAQGERALVEAQDRLDDAKRDTTVDNLLREDERKGSEVGKHLERVIELEERRDKLKVAYAMTHVYRVKVVSSILDECPRWQEFMHTQPGSAQRKFDWKRYCGNTILYHYSKIGAHYVAGAQDHPLEPDIVRSHVERLAVVTAPWQAWLMDIRSVYRWDNPARTTRWLFIYSILWYTQHFVAFLVGWIIWSTLRNRFVRASAHGIRQSMKRAADGESVARHLEDLLDRHGSEGWLDEVRRTVGPGTQMLMGDMADFLEVLANFGEWKSPKHTAATLVLLFVNLLACTTSWTFGARYIYGVLGLMFFVLFPIQALHPRYRYVASLFTILLFNIPTHAQWAFAHLRRRALLGQLDVIDHERQKPDGLEYPAGIKRPTSDVRECTNELAVPAQEGDRLGSRLDELEEYQAAVTMPEREGTPAAGVLPPFVDELGSTPLVTFHANSNGKRGRLVMTASGVHFQRAGTRQVLWTMAFDRFKEMRKLDSIDKLHSVLRTLTKDKAVSSGDRILFEDVDGSERVVQLHRDSDECFNCIIGFSGLQWQKV